MIDITSVTADPTRISRIAAAFHDDGFAIVKNIIPHDLVDSILADVLRAAESGRITKPLRDIHRTPNEEISSMHNLVDYVPRYFDIINYKPILEIFDSIYGEKSNLVFNSSYFAKPEAVGYETKPHQDNAFFCMTPPEVVTCWFPVEFADIRNGALYYFKGSWRAGNIPHMAEGNLGASMCLDNDCINKIDSEFEKTYVPLSKGDCVVHNALVVHGSEANSSPYHRKAFNFSLASKKAVRDEVMFSEYQTKLKLFLMSKKSLRT